MIGITSNRKIWEIHRMIDRITKKIRSKLWTYTRSERELRRKRHEAEERISRDRSYFSSLKGKFAGRRGFVIGNGPSLSVRDLDKLQGEVCIASNKIYLAFDETAWRPSFHTVVDPLVWAKISGALGKMIPTVMIPHYLPLHPGCSADVRTFRSIGNAPDLSDKTDEILFSEDFANGAYGGYTVTYENIQLAVHLGLNPIYVIGCDHYYEGEKNVVANEMISAPPVSNHFVQNYREPGEIVNVAPIGQMNKGYQMAQRYAAENGITLLNATRGGFLEAFPRANFDGIIAGSGLP